MAAPPRTAPAGARSAAEQIQTGETTIAKNLRRNEQIRISPIRLIDEQNQQIGIVEIKEALNRAMAAGMDLVEVAPQSRPPVCRIMDFGKWMYAQRKKEQKAKAHRHETELKQIRIKTPKIGEHDLAIKVGHAKDFLGRGDRVQFTIRFRGRELAHIDEGLKVFEQITTALGDISKVEQSSRREGRRITMLLAPAAKKEAPAKKSSAEKGEPPAQPPPEAQAQPQAQDPQPEGV